REIDGGKQTVRHGDGRPGCYSAVQTVLAGIECIGVTGDIKNFRKIVARRERSAVVAAGGIGRRRHDECPGRVEDLDGHTGKAKGGNSISYVPCNVTAPLSDENGDRCG